MDGSVFKELAETIESGFKILLGICVVSVPLGLWKLIEIIVWLCHYIGAHWK